MNAPQTVGQVRLTLEVREHAVFPDRPGGASSASTLEFVPGTALRGALAQRYLRRRVAGDPGDDFHRLFEQQLRFLDGRLQIDAVRSAPVPRSARRCKVCREASRKDLVEEEAPTQTCPTCGGEFTSFTGWWVRGTGGSADRFAEVSTTFLGRTSIEDGTARQGSLRFATCLGADSGDRFESRIVGDPTQIEDLLDRLDLRRGTRLRMGAASSVGGSFEVMEDPAVVDPVDPDIDGDSRVAVDLLSRAILVDPFLRPVTVPEPPPGWTVAEQARQPCVYTSLDEVHGWNAGQQLPKPADVALSAGSVAVLAPDGDVAPQTRRDGLRRWLSGGIGLRRSEGFGEVDVRAAPAPTSGEENPGSSP